MLNQTLEPAQIEESSDDDIYTKLDLQEQDAYKKRYTQILKRILKYLFVIFNVVLFFSMLILPCLLTVLGGASSSLCMILSPLLGKAISVVFISWLLALPLWQLVLVTEGLALVIFLPFMYLIYRSYRYYFDFLKQLNWYGAGDTFLKENNIVILLFAWTCLLMLVTYVFATLEIFSLLPFYLIPNVSLFASNLINTGFIGLASSLLSYLIVKLVYSYADQLSSAYDDGNDAGQELSANINSNKVDIYNENNESLHLNNNLTEGKCTCSAQASI